ncbi:hypothetical protein [Flavobacterium eburneipallidum]|uniref:hypothetical protein n=1 Tax=Flavobacterium eburneipallidum TaxID=3003263 RepID=UPI0022AC27CE|nr:hypothetical protein [Flavobacterium eburneipallidum]
MKTQILLLTLMTSVFVSQMQGQNRTIVSATNSEISDNLDLRVVASIFGDSRNLQDFERQLNDPKLQISNLDLNNDYEVDYLRVIESVENRTHLVIIQSVLDRDLYQDVATIEVEKDRYNQVQIQVVGNAYMYGDNYIYEPVYYRTPLIYASFWVNNYRPYYSSWSWNIYPSYYYAWNPYPVFRYRHNVNNCLNNYYSYNSYNYVNHRRSSVAVGIYSSRRSNGYERQYPNYSFARRNTTVNNRYELDQKRNNRNNSYSQNRTQSQRVATPQRTESNRNYSQNRTEAPRVTTQQRTESNRNYSQNRTEAPRVTTQQRTESRNYSQNRTETPRVVSQQRVENQRANTPQRPEVRNENSSRNSGSNNANTNSRSNGRRSS